MNKKQILTSLNKIANELDNNDLFKEANTLTNIMIKVADEFNIEPNSQPVNNSPEQSNNIQQNQPQPFIKFDLLTKTDDQSFTKTEGFTIGRQGDIVTPSEINTVSRQHCHITTNRYGKWAVYDLGSKAGTKLNGNQLSPRVGQELKIHDGIYLDPWVVIEIIDMYPLPNEKE